MLIRKIKQTDNLPLADMIRTVFEEHDAPKTGTVYSDPTTDNLYGLFQSERAVLWVATVDDEILGCCGIYPTAGLPEDCAELVKFYLAQKARGQGIGKALMEKSINSAKELGYLSLYLESMPHFAKAVRIYKQLGFQTLDHPLGASGHSSCHIWMLKTLAE